MSLAYGLLLLIGAASGANDPLRPLQAVAIGGQSAAGGHGFAASEQVVWHEANDLPALRASLASASVTGKPVLLDLVRRLVYLVQGHGA